MPNNYKSCSKESPRFRGPTFRMTRVLVIPKSCRRAAPEGRGTLTVFSSVPSALAVILGTVGFRGLGFRV